MPSNILNEIYKNKVLQGLDFPLVNIKNTLLIIGDSYSAGSGGYQYLKDALASLCGVTTQNNRASGGTRNDYSFTTSSVMTVLLNNSSTINKNLSSTFYYYGFNDVGQGTSPIDTSPNLTSNNINESVYSEQTLSILHNCCCDNLPSNLALANNTTSVSRPVGTWSAFTSANTWSLSASTLGASLETSNVAFTNIFRYASFHFIQTGNALNWNIYVNNTLVSVLKRPANILPSVLMGLTVMIDLEIESNYVLKVEIGQAGQHQFSHFCVWNDNGNSGRETICIEKNRDTRTYDSRYDGMSNETYFSRQELYKKGHLESVRQLRGFNLPISFFEMPYLSNCWAETNGTTQWHPNKSFGGFYEIPSYKGTQNLNN